MRVENVFANFEHDVNICFEYEGRVYSYELERLFKIRYFGFASPEGWARSFEQLSHFKNVLLMEFGVSNVVFENLYYNEDLMWGDKKSQCPDNFRALFANKNVYELDHHECHAAGAFYQSPYEEALVFSYDGGGMGANVRSHTYAPDDWDYTVLYLASRKGGIRRLCKIPINFGGLYNQLCTYPDVIQWDKKIASMAGCGKFMGLSGHSTVDPFIVSELKDRIMRNPFCHKGSHTMSKDGADDWGFLEPFGYERVEGAGKNYITDFKESATFASNWQEAFEQVVLEVLRPYVEKYNYPICVTGGCALNVLVNQRIRTHFNREVFVPTNPSDCGLAVGGMAIHTDIDIRNTVYNNFDLMDRHLSSGGVSADVPECADIICGGKILGVVNMRSECGPRALGNRSILCDPSIPDMKDILNAKVKFREWFRPFAPMVRYEDRNKYFVFDGDSPYMSFACPVRETYRDELSAITHVDGTARLQTVKESDNAFIYNLLTELEIKGNIPVLLNTSFNIKGKPILTFVEDALEILMDTELDNVFIEGKLF